MSADKAIGLAVNQQIFARGIQAQELATPLGLTKSSVSRKLRGNVSWSADEVLRTAMFFGIEPADPRIYLESPRALLTGSPGHPRCSCSFASIATCASVTDTASHASIAAIVSGG